VYTIDPSTAVATPVAGGQFSPKIVDFFEIHFAMALEPNGDRVRLISTEGGTNWSISLDDGTAVTGAVPRHVGQVSGDAAVQRSASCTGATESREIRVGAFVPARIS
jgi:hypothetical protein